MMRSLFSGVTGLKVHQTRMDVIGNNIANVNTVGFKSSGVNFSDVFYQTTQNATGPNAATGAAGQNAMQIGLGATVSSITTNITATGGSQRTDNPLDVMINGDSFFIVNSGGTNYFTKAGSFGVDAGGTLYSKANGGTVMGWQVDATTGQIVPDTVSPLKVMAPENLYLEPEATTAATVSGNIDKNSTEVQSTGTGYPLQVSFYDNLGNECYAKFSIKQSATQTGSVLQYDVALTDVTDKAGNSLFVKKTGSTYAAGALTQVKIGSSTISASVNSTTGAVTLTGTALPLKYNAATGAFTEIDTPAGNKTVNMSFTATPNTFSASGVNIDFSKTTMYSNSGTTDLKADKGSTTGTGAGSPVGNMTGISVDKAGKIYGTYDNGNKKLLGQIAVATFANPSGLESVGNSMFAETQNSGSFSGVGQDPTKGGGSLTTGVLEMSNVDLASEFTTMITTQRGFQANSKIITTSDSMLEELVNLKR